MKKQEPNKIQEVKIGEKTFAIGDEVPSIKKVKRNKRSVANTVYMAIVGLLEEKEAKGQYKGNGHHLAQDLAWRIEEAFLPPQQRKIYSFLTKVPAKTKHIALQCGITERTVAVQLQQIHNNTHLLGMKRDGKLKSWWKLNDDNKEAAEWLKKEFERTGENEEIIFQGLGGAKE